MNKKLDENQKQTRNMSNFSNSKRVKLSSTESGIKPEDEDEASAVEENEPIAGCSHSANRKTSKDASVTAEAVATSDTSEDSDLVEDVLMQIFEMDFFDATDLLNFRLVNRLWRDSATSVLLKRSDCQISLNICSVHIPSTYAGRVVYCNNNNYDAWLKDLNQIISQSPKFPCFSFRFVSNSIFQDPQRRSRIDTSSLQQFFSVYGNSVKSITVSDLIFKKDLRSMLVNDTPCLECLDLQYMKSVFTKPLFSKSTILPNLKTLILGPCTDFNLMALVDAAINLESIESTNFDSLKLLVDHGKVGLIKKLEYFMHVYVTEELDVFEKLAESEPKLTKLIVTPVEIAQMRNIHDMRWFYETAQVFLSRILKSSNDTLKYLEFRICRFGDLEFPRLPNLECLKLVQASDECGGLFFRSPSYNPELLPLDLDEDDQRRCPNRPCDSFPNLRKLQLDIQNYGFEKDGSLILLHTCQSHNQKIVPHVYESLKVLEIHSTLPKTIKEAQSASNLFRSVTILKVKISKVQELSCSLWVLCPLVKSIEIYGVCNSPCYEEGRRYWGSSSNDERMNEVGLVDSFFTGFPIELCQKLKEGNQFPMEIEGNPSLMNFLRVKPNMCDLKDLTDFKILFRCLEATFASRVTGSYAFRNMPRTSITFAHPSSNKCNEAECELEKYLAPVSLFVHVTHQNIPCRFQNVNE